MKLNRIGASFLGLVLSFFPKRNVGHIYIIGPPRSGTTITYQRFIKSFDIKYLDNYLHLTFGVPFIRGLSNLVAPSMEESSHHGFVGGLRGAAEGLHFWKYWFGAKLTYSETIKLKGGFAKYIDYLEFNKRPFTTCYIPHLGHAQEILDQDLNAFIIILRRNSNDVSNSLRKIYIEKTIPEYEWFSYQPLTLPETKGLDAKLNAQVEFYSKLIEKDSKAEDARILEVTYEEMVEFSSSTKNRILRAYNTFAKARRLSILKER